MRGLLQRVTAASVIVDGEVTSSIGRGILAFVGIASDDDPAQREWIVRKILVSTNHGCSPPTLVTPQTPVHTHKDALW